MEFIESLREDRNMSALLSTACDVKILSELRPPENESGHLSYNILGTTFAQTGSGSEYILLGDGSIGYWESEGACGRIADSLHDFFEFVIRCPYWQDYLFEDIYRDRERLCKFAKENIERLKKSFKEDGFDLFKAQQRLADYLN